MTEQGIGHAGDLLRVLFGGDVGDTDVKDRQRRRQYALRVLTPIGLACLQRSEELGGASQSTAFSVGDVLGWAETPTTASTESTGYGYETALEEEPPKDSTVPKSVLNYLEGPASERGGGDWSICDVEILVERSKMDAVIQNVLQKALSDMTEVIGHLDCDVLLMSGRPSRLPAVREIVRETMVVPPSRLISMHEYKVGSWFPYRDRITNRIGDPKSTAAVGGMLCTLAESRIADFTASLAGRS